MKPANNIGEIVSPISIRDFSSRNSQNKHQMTNAIKAGLSKNNYIKVLKIGGKAVLTGSLTIGRIHNNHSFKRYTDKKGKTHSLYSLTKRSISNATYSLTNVSGEMLSSGRFSTKFDEKETSYQSKSDVISKSNTDDEIIQTMISKLAQDIVAAISPTQVIQQIELARGDHEGFKHGTAYMVENRVDQAINIWEQILNHTSDREEKAAAFYNIGVAKEVPRKI